MKASGVVFVEGRLVERGRLLFTDTSSRLEPIWVTVKEGKFSIRQEDGLLVGLYQVEFVRDEPELETMSKSIQDPNELQYTISAMIEESQSLKPIVFQAEKKSNDPLELRFSVSKAQ